MAPMTASCTQRSDRIRTGSGIEAGFSLAELLTASLVLFLISAAAFRMLAETQRTASYQAEVQAILDNTRMAMDTVERYVRHAGNDPHNVGIAGITITSGTEVRLRSDLTGSAGPSNADKGDPDGDTLDSGEDVTIRYDAAARSLQLVPDGGSAQTIASDISAFTMQYYDANGAATTVGSNVRKINVSISGASTITDPQTGKAFGITLTSDVQIATRQY